MDRSSLDLVSDVLAGSRRLFYYTKDEYARYLLERQLGQSEALKLQEIQSGHWARLLERPLIKAQRGQWGDGLLTHARLQALRATNPLKFRITFDEWGTTNRRWSNWDQVSRPGYNLVIQLNFSGDHNEQYFKLLQPQTYRHPFKYGGHPSRAYAKDFTLAWARVDLSADFSEALVEEIQSDWWRAARAELIERHHRKRDANGQWREWTTKRSRHSLEVEQYERYLTEVLQAYGEVWDEAILTATLQLLWEEIGVERIFYHTYETGCVLKNCQPPRSLYTKLPKRFCFNRTEEAPTFLTAEVQRWNRKLKGKSAFWVLA